MCLKDPSLFSQFLFLTELSLWTLDLTCPAVKWLDVDKSKGPGLLISVCRAEMEKEKHQ